MTLLPELGARLHRLQAFGHDVLRTPDDLSLHEREPFFWGGYVMAPWGGRIDSRPTEVAGRTVDMPANFPDGTAIHGQLHSVPWQMTAPGEFSVSGGGDGWPWRYGVTCSYAVIGRSVRVEQTVSNVDDSLMPAGVGLHPWFRRPVVVTIDASVVFDSNTDSAPAPRSVDGAWDARPPNALSDGVDATWTRLGDPPVTLTWPGIGVRASMRMSSRAAYVVAASPSDLDAVAVEPQTHAPQGLRRLINGEPGALTLLEPGGSLSLTTELTFERVREEMQ